MRRSKLSLALSGVLLAVSACSDQTTTSPPSEIGELATSA